MDIIYSLYHYPIISNRVVAYPIIIIKKLFSIAYPNTHLSIPTPSCFSKLARPSQRPLAWQPMAATGILYLFSIPRENGPCIDNLLYVHTLLVTYVYIHDRTFIYSICPCICIYIYMSMVASQTGASTCCVLALASKKACTRITNRRASGIHSDNILKLSNSRSASGTAPTLLSWPRLQCLYDSCLLQFGFTCIFIPNNHSLSHYPINIKSCRSTSFHYHYTAVLHCIPQNPTFQPPTPNCFSKLAPPSQRPVDWQPMATTGNCVYLAYPGKMAHV